MRQKIPSFITKTEQLAPAPFWLTMIALVSLAFALRLNSMLNHDTSWYLHATARVLHGARLYVDIIEVNPPLAFLLTMPPVASAQALSLDASLAFKIYIFLLGAFSLGVSGRLVRLFPTMSASRARGFLLISALVFFILPAGDFGQREHMAIMFVWPYIILAALRMEGRGCGAPMAVLAGAMAFFGFGLKPHFLLVPLALEAHRLVRLRRFGQIPRPETIVLAIMLLAYLAGIFLLTPEYPGKILPMALAVYNLGYRSSLFAVLLSGAGVPFLLAGLWWSFPADVKAEEDSLSSAFMSAGAAFFLIFLIQRKGWSYHLLPVLSCLYAAMTLRIASMMAKTGTARRWVKGGNHVWLAALLVAIIIPAKAIRNHAYHNDAISILREAHVLDKPVSSYYIFTTQVSAGFPLINVYHMKWPSRFPTQWLLPGVVIARHQMRHDPASHDKATIDAIEAYAKDAVITDLLRHPPDLIAVDRRNPPPYMGKVKFAFLPYYLRDPRFAKFWQGYKKAEKVHVLQLYRRKQRISAAQGPGQGQGLLPPFPRSSWNEGARVAFSHPRRGH